MKTFIQICDEGRGFAVYYDNDVLYGTFKFHIIEQVAIITKRHNVPIAEWMRTRRFNEMLFTALNTFMAKAVVGVQDKTRYMVEHCEHSEHALDAMRYFARSANGTR